MRTTLNIEDALLEDAKQAAAQRRVTLDELVEDALRVYLSASKPFQLPTVQGTLVQPGVKLDRTSELLAQDDMDRYA